MDPFDMCLSKCHRAHNYMSKHESFILNFVSIISNEVFLEIFRILRIYPSAIFMNEKFLSILTHWIRIELDWTVVR